MNALIDVTNIRIETERMILRPWRESDLADLYAYARVDGVGQMAGWLPHVSMQQSWVVLASFIARKKVFALELKETGRVIGSLGIERVEDMPEIPERLLGRELGFVLSRKYWGRGLMPEAVSAVTGYCFKVLGYEYLTCAHFVRNTQCRRVMEKTGFVYLKDTLHETHYGTVEETKMYIQYNPKLRGNYV